MKPKTAYWAWPSVLDCLKCGGTRADRNSKGPAWVKCESCQGTGTHAIPMEEVINWRCKANLEMPWWNGGIDED